MGIVRLLLALSVVLAHAGPIAGNPLVGGQAAVQTFYIISGFYMALILNEKYLPGPGSTRLFLGSRLLRLGPVYLAVLVGTLLAQAALPGLFHPSVDAGGLPYWRAHTLSPGSAAWLGFVNLAALGQDATLFMAVRPAAGTLYFTPRFSAEPLPAYQFLFIPQAWTLGLELLFYAVAPLLVRRRAPALAAWIAASLAVRVFLALRLGLRHDPWSYRFFPSELALFLLGALAYRAYRRLRETVKPDAFGPRAAQIAAPALLLLYPFVPGHGKGLLLYPAMAALFPWLFLRTQRSRFDRYLGDLSYPVYLCHLLLVEMLQGLGIRGGLPAVILSLFVAVCLLEAIDRPIDRLRQRWVARAQPALTAAP